MNPYGLNISPAKLYDMTITFAVPCEYFCLVFQGKCLKILESMYIYLKI